MHGAKRGFVLFGHAEDNLSGLRGRGRGEGEGRSGQGGSFLHHCRTLTSALCNASCACLSLRGGYCVRSVTPGLRVCLEPLPTAADPLQKRGYLVFVSSAAFVWPKLLSNPPLFRPTIVNHPSLLLAILRLCLEFLCSPLPLEPVFAPVDPYIWLSNVVSVPGIALIVPEQYVRRRCPTPRCARSSHN